MTEFQRVAERMPDSAIAQVGAGVASYSLNEYAAAEAAFRQCLKLDPDLVSARLHRAMTFAEEGKIDDALLAWPEVLAKSGDLPDEDRRHTEREVTELRAAPSPAATPARKSPDTEPR